MADSKISALPSASSVAGGDLFAIVQGGTTKKISATNMSAFFGSTYSAGNGLALSSSVFKLGGTLTENTFIDADSVSNFRRVVFGGTVGLGRFEAYSDDGAGNVGYLRVRPTFATLTSGNGVDTNELSITPTNTTIRKTITLTDGTASRVLGTNASNVVEYINTTGTGDLVRATSPTFGTDITTPLIIGGSAAGSTISYKGTSANGTSTVAAHQFLVGNNGASTILSIFNDGRSTFSPIGGGTLSIVSASTVSGVNFSGTYTLAEMALWGTGTTTVVNTPQTLNFRVANATQLAINNTTHVFSNTASASSGTVTSYTFNIGANTGQTASTEVTSFKVNGANKTWANGGAATTIATQRFNHFTTNTALTSGGGSLTITALHNFYIDAPAVSGVTATNSYALGLGGHLFVANSSLVPANNPTGGGVLYVEAGALKFRGSSGTVTTIAAA